MRILITNDDGVHSEGLKILAEWATKLGDVTIVAPKHEQSGKSHSIELVGDMEIMKIDDICGCPTYYVDSSPADCVRYGIVGLKQNYDMIFAGINHGYNMGTDILYSGTVGSIFEAALHGHRAIAFSTSKKTFDVAKAHIDEIYNYIIDNPLFDYCNLYNVNIPIPAKDILITRQGRTSYGDDFYPTGVDNRYTVKGERTYRDTDDLTLDTSAVRSGYITITPMSVERCDVSAYNKLSEIFKKQ